MKVALLLLAVAVVAIDAHTIKIVSEDDRVELIIDDVIDDIKNDLGDDSCPHCNCPAKPCSDRCMLPGCKCSDDSIPNGLSSSQTPQAVVLSFQNAVHVTNTNLYLDLFEGRKNPNNCPATGTFFVSAKYSNFYDVQTLYHQRHEIALNGVEDFTLPTFWYNASVADWCQQINDDRVILSTWARVNPDDIHGFRTPNLYLGGDTQLDAYQNCGIDYDGTRTALNYADDPNVQWPYTYDYRVQADCPNQSGCGKCSHPGVWQFPLQALPNAKDVPCAELSGCSPTDADEVFSMLKKGFLDRYNRNRAPMMISISTAFMLKDAWRQGLERFLDFVGGQKDAYLVSAWQVLDWIKNPKPVCPCSSCDVFPCKRPSPPPPCEFPRDCYYGNDRQFVPRGAPGAIFIMSTCAPRCPTCYPSFKDPQGVNC